MICHDGCEVYEIVLSHTGLAAIYIKRTNGMSCGEKCGILAVLAAVPASWHLEMVRGGGNAWNWENRLL